MKNQNCKKPLSQAQNQNKRSEMKTVSIKPKPLTKKQNKPKKKKKNLSETKIENMYSFSFSTTSTFPFTFIGTRWVGWVGLRWHCVCHSFDEAYMVHISKQDQNPKLWSTYIAQSIIIHGRSQVSLNQLQSGKAVFTSSSTHRYGKGNFA